MFVIDAEAEHTYAVNIEFKADNVVVVAYYQYFDSGGEHYQSYQQQKSHRYCRQYPQQLNCAHLQLFLM